MAIISIHPNNKNQYRKLPLKSTSTFTSDDGYVVPDDLIVNCSITTLYGRHRIYIKQIFFKNTEVRVTIASTSEDHSIADLTLGSFSGNIADDFTTLYLTPFVRNVSGFLTIGSLHSLTKITRTLNFLSTETEFEESKIFCYVPPAVSSITDKKGSEIRGVANFGTLINIAKTTGSKTSKFTATSPDTVLNISDYSSYFGNCPNPVIRSINGVVPSPYGQDTNPQNDSNIYIVGVKPIVFYGIPGIPGVLNVDTSGITLDSLCTQRHKLLPPVDIRGFTENSNEAKNLYYSKTAIADNQIYDTYPYEIPARLASNFNSARRPEFYYWPQFVKKEYYAYWVLTAPSAPVVISANTSNSTVAVVFIPPINEGEHTIDHYEYALSTDGITFGSYVVFSKASNQLTISNLVNDTTYWITLRAIDTENKLGQTSTAVSFTPKA